MDGELGGIDGQDGKADADEQWEELADNYDDWEKKAQEHPDANQSVGERGAPIVAAPPQITKEEWAKHQVTHTFYMHG